MTRSHWSAKRFTYKARKYEQEVGRKPSGFWYDVDGDWARFCRGDEWNLDGLLYRYAVDVNAMLVLRVNGLRELDGFHARFRAPDKYGIRGRWDIDWPRLAKVYDGIEIAPYVWERRHELNWYYGWDCASGCIWNADAVRGVKLMEQEQGVAA